MPQKHAKAMSDNSHEGGIIKHVRKPSKKVRAEAAYNDPHGRDTVQSPRRRDPEIKKQQPTRRQARARARAKSLFSH
jgi:hypothetical protein